MKLKHGDRIRCKINGCAIDDARISIVDGEYYINSNDSRCDGHNNTNFNYKYAWFFDTEEPEDECVSDIKLMHGRFDKYKKRLQESL
jgi:hypothetical protein